MPAARTVVFGGENDSDVTSVDDTSDDETESSSAIADPEQPEPQFDMSSLVVEDSVVAIRANLESLDDYYLFHVTSAGVETLSEDRRSMHGHFYAKGSEVIIGNYYNYKKSTRTGFIYKHDKRDTVVTLVHKDTILYIGIELKTGKDGTSVLETVDHEDILSTAAL